MGFAGRIPMGTCTVLLGRFGAPLSHTVRLDCAEVIAGIKEMQQAHCKNNPCDESRFDTYIARVHSFAAGSDGVSIRSLRTEYTELLALCK
jgi:hypothetical protein